MKFRAFAAAIVGLVGGAPIAIASSSIGYQIDAAHDGHATFKKGFAGPLKREWVVDLGGPISYPVVANGLVFVTVGNTQNYGTQLYALNLKTGETVWHKAIGGTYYWSNLAYDNGRIFLVNFDGQLQAFAADNVGKLAWSEQLPNQYAFETPPNATGGQVFLTGAGSGVTLYAVNEKNGALNWSQVGPAGDSSPAVGDEGVYVTYPCNYYKYNTQTGANIWYDSTGCDGGGGGNPTYFDRRVYVQDFGADVVLDADSGKTKQSFEGYYPAAFWKGQPGNDLGFVLNDGELNSFSVKTGNIGWTFSGDGQLTGSPIVIDDTVVMGSNSGMLYVLDAQTGVTLWSKNVGSPIGEGNGPTTGLGVGGNMLIVPATNQISAWRPKRAE